MARLLSEDSECISILAITVAPTQPDADLHAGQLWQLLTLDLTSGERQLAESCLVCRQPRDEVSELVGLLFDLLAGRRAKILFEPAEPSFELAVERTQEGGMKVEVWLDSGNAASGFYRWDAAGIRFYTTGESLTSFAAELMQEFSPESP